MFCEIDKAGFGLMGTKWKDEKTEASNLFRSCPDITVITCKNKFVIKLIEKSKFVKIGGNY